MMAKSNKRPGRSVQLSGTLHPADQTSRLNDVRHPVPGVCRTRLFPRRLHHSTLGTSRNHD